MAAGFAAQGALFLGCATGAVGLLGSLLSPVNGQQYVERSDFVLQTKGLESRLRDLEAGMSGYREAVRNNSEDSASHSWHLRQHASFLANISNRVARVNKSLDFLGGDILKMNYDIARVESGLGDLANFTVAARETNATSVKEDEIDDLEMTLAMKWLVFAVKAAGCAIGFGMIVGAIFLVFKFLAMKIYRARLARFNNPDYEGFNMEERQSASLTTIRDGDSQGAAALPPPPRNELAKDSEISKKPKK